MDNFAKLLGAQVTPKRRNSMDFQRDMSRPFSTDKKRRHKIFDQTGYKLTEYNSTGKKGFISGKYPTFGLMKQPTFAPLKSDIHIKIQRVINDDYCGCENTLTPCKRIAEGFFQGLFISQLSKQYQQGYTIHTPISLNRIKQLLKQLPQQYPQIYFTHLKNLLSNFQNNQISSLRFRCLAWIHFHIKLEHITYFFYSDLEKTIEKKNDFKDIIDRLMIRENKSMREEIDFYRNRNLDLNQFLHEFYESVGSLVIPLSQYARFLNLLGKNGIKIMASLAVLLLVNKKAELYEILKLWACKQFKTLIDYCRQLNWDLFFDQIEP